MPRSSEVTQALAAISAGKWFWLRSHAPPISLRWMDGSPGVAQPGVGWVTDPQNRREAMNRVAMLIPFTKRVNR